MPSNIQYKHLVDVCDITTGKLDANQAIDGGKYPFFTCAPKPLRIDTFSFEGDVILLAGNNAGGVFHVQRYTGKFNAYQRTYVLNAKEEYDIDYIYYSLLLALEHFRIVSHGSQTRFLTLEILHTFLIADIPLDEQVAQISLLIAIDRKLTLNYSVLSELESLAKLIYDYWFLQFEFPNEEGKPYKSSGGKMVWNEELGREIPEGWSVERLGNVVDVILGGTPDTNISRYWENGSINWLSSGEMANFPIVRADKKITSSAVQESATKLMPKGTVALSITRYIRPTILGIDSCANQSVVGILESETYKYPYVYPYIVNMVNAFLTLRTGAQQPHINKKTVNNSAILCPPNGVLDLYYQIVTPIYELILSFANENLELASLRDWLLPLLMNGQVGFREAEDGQ